RNDGREMSRTNANVEIAQALRFFVFETGRDAIPERTEYLHSPSGTEYVRAGCSKTIGRNLFR
ncbi:hypothetical protein RAC92_25815, partial [Agrobacterium sp. CR_3]|uniref:hypothetical protein n=1 Tax=unclassified Agrobacterium TaxID=2632611 RepID=UPI0035C106ED